MSAWGSLIVTYQITGSGTPTPPVGECFWVDNLGNQYVDNFGNNYIFTCPTIHNLWVDNFDNQYVDNFGNEYELVYENLDYWLLENGDYVVDETGDPIYF